MFNRRKLISKMTYRFAPKDECYEGMKKPKLVIWHRFAMEEEIASSEEGSDVRKCNYIPLS